MNKIEIKMTVTDVFERNLKKRLAKEEQPQNVQSPIPVTLLGRTILLTKPRKSPRT